MPVADKVLALASDDVESAYEMLTRASFYLARNADGSWPEQSIAMKNYRLALSQNHPQTLANDMRACHLYAIDSAALAAITTPALVVVGEKDRMTSVEAGLLVSQQLANSKHLLIPDVGHMMPLEAAAQVIALIVDYLYESYQSPSLQS